MSAGIGEECSEYFNELSLGRFLTPNEGFELWEERLSKLFKPFK